MLSLEIVYRWNLHSLCLHQYLNLAGLKLYKYYFFSQYSKLHFLTITLLFNSLKIWMLLKNVLNLVFRKTSYYYKYVFIMDEPIEKSRLYSYTILTTNKINNFTKVKFLMTACWDILQYHLCQSIFVKTQHGVSSTVE